MLIKALKSKLIDKNDDLCLVIEECIKNNKLKLKEKMIFAITAKVVALTEKRVKKITNRSDFEKIIKKEAKILFPGWPHLSIKNDIFIPNAGIDESNASEGNIILWPQNPYKTAEILRMKLSKLYNLKNLGIIIIDSNCFPLRKGTIATAIAYSGFRGVIDKIGAEDLFGRKLKITKINVADSLAVSANLLMGEGAESCPFAIIEDSPAIFTSKKISQKEILMPKNDCIFNKLYNF